MRPERVAKDIKNPPHTLREKCRSTRISLSLVELIKTRKLFYGEINCMLFDWRLLFSFHGWRGFWLVWNWFNILVVLAVYYNDNPFLWDINSRSQENQQKWRKFNLLTFFTCWKNKLEDKCGIEGRAKSYMKKKGGHKLSETMSSSYNLNKKADPAT